MMMAPTATVDRYETCASLTLTSKSRLFGTEHFAVQELNRIHVIVEYMSCAVASVGCRYRVLDCFHMPLWRNELAVVLPARLWLEKATRFRRTPISRKW